MAQFARMVSSVGFEFIGSRARTETALVGRLGFDANARISWAAIQIREVAGPHGHPMQVQPKLFLMTFLHLLPGV